MPSHVLCENGHRYGLCRDAAIEIAERGSLSTCKICGKSVHYIVEQKYPRIQLIGRWELIRVARIYDEKDATEEGYDPMIFLLRDQTGYEAVWPFYWVKSSKTGRWIVGQFPPIMPGDKTIEALKKLGIVEGNKVVR
jgi:hypothetical protein